MLFCASTIAFSAVAFSILPFLVPFKVLQTCRLPPFLTQSCRIMCKEQRHLYLVFNGLFVPRLGKRLGMIPLKRRQTGIVHTHYGSPIKIKNNNETTSNKKFLLSFLSIFCAHKNFQQASVVFFFPPEKNKALIVAGLPFANEKQHNQQRGSIVDVITTPPRKTTRANPK